MRLTSLVAFALLGLVSHTAVAQPTGDTPPPAASDDTALPPAAPTPLDPSPTLPTEPTGADAGGTEGPAERPAAAPQESQPTLPPPQHSRDYQATTSATTTPSMTLTDLDPVVTERPGAHTHDGFYFRLASGFGAYSEALRSEDAVEYDGRVEARSRGISVVSEIAVGGTVSRGVVIGAGVYSDDIVVSNLDVDGAGTVPEEIAADARNFTLFGVFADWYFNPKKGLHAQAALGFAQVRGIDVTGGAFDGDDYHASGPGLMLGLGYDWWVADEWSIGLLGRITTSVLWGEDEAGVEWSHATLTTPAFLLTLTYH